MPSREAQLVYLNYLQSIIEKPRKVEDQLWVKRDGRFMWCQDWEIIEILKCLANGDDYLGDPPPNRLEGNPLWNKEDIIKKARHMTTVYKTPAEIVQRLKEWREGKVDGA